MKKLVDPFYKITALVLSAILATTLVTVSANPSVSNPNTQPNIGSIRPGLSLESTMAKLNNGQWSNIEYQNQLIHATTTINQIPVRVSITHYRNTVCGIFAQAPSSYWLELKNWFVEQNPQATCVQTGPDEVCTTPAARLRKVSIQSNRRQPEYLSIEIIHPATLDVILGN